MASPVVVGMLHGDRQSAAALAQYAKTLVKIGEKEGLSFVFLDAPYERPEGGRTWLARPLDIAEIGLVGYEPSIADYTLQVVGEWIKDKGITVLCGFSQGANIVDAYLRQTHDPSIHRIVLLSGYSFVGMADPPVIPCLNVYSKADTVVSWELAPQGYLCAEPLEHPKGHQIPSSKPQLRQIVAFLAGDASDLV